MGQIDFQVGHAFALRPSELPPKTIERILVVSEKKRHPYYRRQFASNNYVRLTTIDDYLEAKQELLEALFLVHVIHLDLEEINEIGGLKLAEMVRDAFGNPKSVYLASKSLKRLGEARKNGFYAKHTNRLDRLVSDVKQYLGQR